MTESKKGKPIARAAIPATVLLVVVTFFCGLYARGLNVGLPLYYDKMGYAAVVGGLFVSVYTLSSMVMRLVGGRITDTFDHIKVLYISLSTLLLGVAIPAFFSDFAVVMAARVLQGMGFALSVNVISVLLMEIAPHAKIGIGISVMGIGSSLATMLGAVVATGLLDGLGFIWFFLFYVIICGASIVLVFIVSKNGSVKTAEASVEESRAAAKKSAIATAPATTEGKIERKAKHQLAAYYNPQCVPYFVISFARRMPKGMCTAFVLIYAHQIGIGHAALFFVVAGLLEVCGRALGAKHYDTLNKVALLPMIALNVIGFGALFIWPTYWTFYLAAASYGLSIGTASPFLKTLTAKSVDKSRWGTVNGELYFTGDLGLAFASFFAGVLLDTFGKLAFPGVALGFSVAATLIIAVALFFCKEHAEKTQK